MTHRRFTLVVCTALAVLGGCTVGPRYAGPPPVAPHAASGAAFARAGDLKRDPPPALARWWEALGDPGLNDLETQALAANPDLAAAKARIRQARASLREQRANQAPSLDATALYAHAELPGVDFGSVTGGQSTSSGASSGSSSASGSSSGSGSTSLDIYDVGFDASWEIDLFGGQRRAVQAAGATAEAAAADLADVEVSLTAEVAVAYLNVRDRQARIGLNAQIVAKQNEMLNLTRQRFDQGTASKLDVERLTQQLDRTRADAVPLRAELDAYADELAVLTGQEPGALDAALAESRPLPLPPAEVAVGDPATLLKRRPDVRAAERTLAADTAKVGQAEAARFPQLKFMGIIGVGGTQPSNLTNLDDLTTLIAPQLSWSFLDFGRTKARVTEADAVREEAEAKYRKAVLGALRDAEDTLSRFRYRRISVAVLARTKASADQAAALQKARYAAGTATLIDLLDAERQQVETDQSLSVATAGLSSDFVSIQKALGLGWEAGR